MSEYLVLDMARPDEIGVGKLMDFQSEVVAEVGLDDYDELRREAWKWVQENDVDPADLERTLVRYSENFAPGAGGQPLALGDEPPEDLE